MIVFVLVIAAASIPAYAVVRFLMTLGSIRGPATELGSLVAGIAVFPMFWLLFVGIGLEAVAAWQRWRANAKKRR